MITIIDVMRDMGVEVSKAKSWEIGGIVRELWKDAHNGELPEKQLRAKTAGLGGSHMFAVYPEQWRPTIEKVVREAACRPEPQLAFNFFPEVDE